MNYTLESKDYFKLKFNQKIYYFKLMDLTKMYFKYAKHTYHKKKACSLPQRP